MTFDCGLLGIGRDMLLDLITKTIDAWSWLYYLN